MQVNQFVTFSGYNPPLPPGTPPNLTVGEIVEIYSQGQDGEGSWNVRSITNVSAVETCHERELVEISAEAAAEAAATLAANMAPAAPAAQPAAPALSGDAPVAAKRGRKPKAPALDAEGNPIAPTPKPAKAPKPEKAPKPAKEAPVLTMTAPAPTFTDTQLVIDLVSGGDVVSATRKLLKDSSENSFALGGVLSYTKRTKAHLTILGEDGKTSKYADTPEGFECYLVEELGIADGYRVMQYKIKVYEGLASRNLAPEVLQEFVALGYTKLKDLVDLLKDGNEAEVLGAVKGKNAKEIQDYVRETKVALGLGGTRATADKKAFHFVLFQDIAAVAKQAIDDAKSKTQGADPNTPPTDSEAFAYIVGKYLEGANTAPVPVETAIELLELRYGIKLAVTNNDTVTPALDAMQPAATE